MYSNWFFTFVFVVEMFMKILALGMSGYLDDKWNQLDMVIVILSVIGIILECLEMWTRQGKLEFATICLQQFSWNNCLQRFPCNNFLETIFLQRFACNNLLVRRDWSHIFRCCDDSNKYFDNPCYESSSDCSCIETAENCKGCSSTAWNCCSCSPSSW